MVWKFDRFARSVSHLLRALETFNGVGVAFVSLTEQMDTTTKGKRLGRTRAVVDASRIEALRAQGNWNETEAAERFQVPLSTLNQKIKRLGIDTRRRPGAVRGAAGFPAQDPAESPVGK